jgi:hypothetical protein
MDNCGSALGIFVSCIFNDLSGGSPWCGRLTTRVNPVCTHTLHARACGSQSMLKQLLTSDCPPPFPTHRAVALSVIPVFLLPLMVFSGFFVNSNSIPPYFNWIQCAYGMLGPSRGRGWGRRRWRWERMRYAQGGGT